MLRNMQTLLLRKGLGIPSVRFVVSESGLWQGKYKRQTRVDLEKFWKKKLTEKWESRNVATSDDIKPKFYCLSMFPYPSGRLHMGHVRVYTISDTFAHFYRMNGYNVIHPMGWDAFGLPAENAAKDRGLDPKEWTLSNIEYMKNQLKDLNLMFDWERELSTCDPKYYMWTQYIFIKLFQANLAYQKDALVNWDPVDQTVLADEQVDEEGRSWRSGAVVEQKYMKQWFLKATDYSEPLLESLPRLEEHYGIKAMQKHWIGEINGCYFEFTLANDEKVISSLSIFCTNPKGVSDSSHVVIQEKYKGEIAHLLEKRGEKQLADQIITTPSGNEVLVNGCHVINPFTGDNLPLTISDKYENIYEKTPVILAIPRLDETAELMAQSHNIPYSTHCSNDSNSSDILQKAKSMGVWNGKMYSSKLRDWLISRQRYWGTPIPIIHCPEHGPVAVPIEDLPVELPGIQDVTINPGQSPLASVSDWVNTTCPVCGSPAKRETDTMDTFVDSSWYYLRYIDPENTAAPFCTEKANKIMPVDLYIGGKEHAVLHLYFARFINHFLSDETTMSHKEPFKKLLAQGLIKGLTHQVKSTGKYIAPDNVNRSGTVPVTKDTGEEVEESFQKMSKSKFNGIDPVDFVNEWGISLTRLYVLYAAAPFEDIHWDVKTDVIPGVMRLQMKLWKCVTRIINARKEIPKNSIRYSIAETKHQQNINSLNIAINKAVVDITKHYREDCVLSAVITCLMILAKILSNTSDHIIRYSQEFERGLCAIVIMSAPMVPHFASELWSGLQLMEYKLTEQNWRKDVLEQAWPKSELYLFHFSKFKILVNGEVCDSLRLPAVVTDWRSVQSTIMKSARVNERLQGLTPSRFKVDEDKFEIHIYAS